MKFEFSFFTKENRSKTISSFPWRPPRIWSNIEAKFIFWCPKLKKKKSVLAKILSFGELLTLSGRITLEIPHGIYASHGRSLAACNISPPWCVLYNSCRYLPKTLAAEGPLHTYPSCQHTLSHLSQLPAIYKIIGFCHDIFPLWELVWCKVLN